jgi:hypothetical protein
LNVKRGVVLARWGEPEASQRGEERLKGGAVGAVTRKQVRVKGIDWVESGAQLAPVDRLPLVGDKPRGDKKGG